MPLQRCCFCSGSNLSRILWRWNLDLDGCKDYVGVACINGTCPKTIKEEYEEQSRSIIHCGQCFLNMGCEDCALAGTEYCKTEDKEESR